MDSGDFARRHGYREPQISYGSYDYIPKFIRVNAALAIIGDPREQSDVNLFSRAVLETLPPSRGLWEWFSSVEVIPIGIRQWGTDRRLTASEQNEAIDGLVQPLKDCDWRLFYAVVEKVCEAWRGAETTKVPDETRFNLLLRSHRIPWELHSGKVIPVADSEFADNLEYVRQALSSLESDDSNDPHVLLKDALDALYSKQGGPNIAAACVNAWGAWKAAAGEVSGYGARDNRAFEFVKSNYPKLYDTMNAWQKLAESGRHPESEGSPTESETRFIVMLCVNAVRFLGSTRGDGADA